MKEWEWVDISGFESEDWAEFYKFWLKVNSESTPYREEPTFDGFQKKWTSFQNRIVIRCFVVKKSEEILAAGRHWYEAESSPTYEANQFHLNTLLWAVASKDRERALDFVCEFLKGMALPRKFKTWQFILSQRELTSYLVRGQGMKIVNHLEELGLLKVDIEKDKLDRLCAVDSEVHFRELSPSTELDQIAKIYSDTYLDVPFQSAVQSKINYDRSYFEERLRQVDLQGERLRFFGVFDREFLCGITIVQSKRVRPQVFEIDYSAIAKEARGRGLGKRMKAELVLFLLREERNFQAIITGNNESNLPILAINRWLGFKVLNDYNILHADVDSLTMS